jgi:Fur family transcriptional regulator, peroxide stress response regulator
MEEFRRYCRQAGLSLTHQRGVIYRALLEMRSHPDPETVYRKVRKAIPSISLATVYKNIRTFLDAGLMRELSCHHGTLRLETNPKPHHHMVCTRCKAIVDIEESAVGPVRMSRKPPGGFRVANYSIEFLGTCQTCAGS